MGIYAHTYKSICKSYICTSKHLTVLMAVLSCSTRVPRTIGREKVCGETSKGNPEQPLRLSAWEPLRCSGFFQPRAAMTLGRCCQPGGSVDTQWAELLPGAAHRFTFHLPNAKLPGEGQMFSKHSVRNVGILPKSNFLDGS